MTITYDWMTDFAVGFVYLPEDEDGGKSLGVYLGILALLLEM